jgi:hypothetical protein
VADPGDGDLAALELGKNRMMRRAPAPREPAFPDHFLEKRARIEMLRRRQILEGPGQPVGRWHGTIGSIFYHDNRTLTPSRLFDQFEIEPEFHPSIEPQENAKGAKKNQYWQATA